MRRIVNKCTSRFRKWHMWQLRVPIHHRPYIILWRHILRLQFNFHTISLSVNDVIAIVCVCVCVCLYELDDRKRFYRSKMTFLDIRTFEHRTYWEKLLMGYWHTIAMASCIFACLIYVVVGFFLLALSLFCISFLLILLIVLSTSNLAKWPYFITRNFDSISIFTHTHTFSFAVYC